MMKFRKFSFKLGIDWFCIGWIVSYTFYTCLLWPTLLRSLYFVCSSDDDFLSNTNLHQIYTVTKIYFQFSEWMQKKTSEQAQKTTFWLEHIQTIQHSFFQKIYVRFLCKTRSSKCKWHFTWWQIRKFHHISKLFPIYFLLRPFSFHIFTFLAFDSNDREGKPRPQKRNWKFFSRRIRILSS